MNLYREPRYDRDYRISIDYRNTEGPLFEKRIDILREFNSQNRGSLIPCSTGSPPQRNIKLGVKLGTKLGVKLGVKLGAKLGVKLGAKLGTKLGVSLFQPIQPNNSTDRTVRNQNSFRRISHSLPHPHHYFTYSVVAGLICQPLDDSIFQLIDTVPLLRSRGCDSSHRTVPLFCSSSSTAATHGTSSVAPE